MARNLDVQAERANLFDTRWVGELPIKCPAADHIGELWEGSAVRCRIERSTISTSNDPRTLAHYCLGNYESCPTWQHDKEADFARKRDRGAA